ncbi:MAG: hypothetical protein ACKOYP_01660, partial [Bacteroidota bacterium]
MNLSQQWSTARNGFSPSFWIANALELFERLAFYGSKAVLAVYLADKVGLTEDAGTLTGLFSGLIYSLPILAGVLVDKYGFRAATTTLRASARRWLVLDVRLLKLSLLLSGLPRASVAILSTALVRLPPALSQSRILHGSQERSASALPPSSAMGNSALRSAQPWAVHHNTPALFNSPVLHF